MARRPASLRSGDGGSARRAAEQARCRSLLDAVDQGVLVVDHAGAPVFANEAARRILRLGDVPDAVAALRAAELTLAAWAPDIREKPAACRALRGEAVDETDTLVHLPDGDVMLRSAIHPVRDRRHRIGGALLLFREVTEEQRTMHRLREAIRAYRLLASNLPDTSLFLVGPDLRFLVAEGKGFREAGYHPEAVEGRTVAEILSEREQVAEGYRHALEGKGTTVESENGGRHFVTRFIPVHDEDSTIVAAMAVSTDVTETRRAQAERERLLAQLADAERFASLGTLASGLAHEMNNPLAVARMCLEILSRPSSEQATSADGEVVQEALCAIDRAVEIVRRMKLLGADRGATLFDPADALGAALAVEGERLAHSGTLERHIEPVPPIAGSAARLTEALRALLDNAIKSFASPTSDANRIQVSMRFEAGCIEISVADNGCGIPPELRARVFDPYFTTRAVGEGVGLGLSMVRSVVTNLGGTVRLDSTEAGGTRVTLRIPPTIAAR